MQSQLPEKNYEKAYSQHKKFVNARVPIHSFISNKSSPLLHNMASNGNLKAVAILINAKADIKARDKAQATALHLAAKNNHLQIIQRLIAAGADINARDKLGKTPLDIAVEYKRIRVAKYLVEKSKLITDYDKHYPLFLPNNITAISKKIKKI